MSDTRQQAHRLIDRLPETQISGLVRFLEAIVDPAAVALRNAPIEDEEIGEEEERAVAGSKEWFRRNEGIPFEQVAAELGFSMDQIRNQRPDQREDPAA